MLHKEREPVLRKVPVREQHMVLVRKAEEQACSNELLCEQRAWPSDEPTGQDACSNSVRDRSKQVLPEREHMQVHKPNRNHGAWPTDHDPNQLPPHQQQGIAQQPQTTQRFQTLTCDSSQSSVFARAGISEAVRYFL